MNGPDLSGIYNLDVRDEETGELMDLGELEEIMLPIIKFIFLYELRESRGDIDTALQNLASQTRYLQFILDKLQAVLHPTDWVMCAPESSWYHRDWMSEMLRRPRLTDWLVEHDDTTAVVEEFISEWDDED